MSSRAHKDAVYEQLARISKAIAAPRRLELLELLGQAPRTVEALADQTGMSVANTSQHLQVLRAAGLVDSYKDGLYVTYRSASPAIDELLLRLRATAEAQLAEMGRIRDRFFATEDVLDAIDADELVRRVRRGEVVLLDVRPTDEFAAAHLPGAVSIPHHELRRRLSELPRGRTIVAYCRGPYCVFAIEAVKLLRRRGFDASRIEDGVVEWRARGMPIDSTAVGVSR